MTVEGVVHSALQVRRLVPPSHPRDAPGLAGQPNRIMLKVRVLKEIFPVEAIAPAGLRGIKRRGGPGA